MIKRLYIDNYKCMVNFTYEPTAFQLILGENGSGKTTAFDVLEKLRDLAMWGMPTESLFPPGTRTIWDSRRTQTFELEIEDNGGRYSYKVQIEHDQPDVKSRIRTEELSFDGNHLFFFDGQDIHLYGDDFTPGPVFPSDGSRSGISLIPDRQDTQKLTRFRVRLSWIFVFGIDPKGMMGYTEKEEVNPDRGMTNFASWYRSVTQVAPEIMAPLFDSLKQVIDGFLGLKLVLAGAEQTRALMVVFKRQDQDLDQASEFQLPFSALSDGQRCLIALFTILHSTGIPEITLCFDEPDNFVSLRELQPWLNEFHDKIEENGGQCLLISHHPEFINQLAVSQGIHFSRATSMHVRAEPFKWSKGDDHLLPSEIIERGWHES